MKLKSVILAFIYYIYVSNSRTEPLIATHKVHVTLGLINRHITLNCRWVDTYNSHHITSFV